MNMAMDAQYVYVIMQLMVDNMIMMYEYAIKEDIHVMLDGHIILTTSLHPMHGLTHIMIALLHLVFPCHP